jgi:CheY-like chemotaxis protein
LDISRALVGSQRGKLVMVIDDNELVRDGTQGLLKSWGCLVLTAESEDAAMARLAEHGRRPDLIISDYHLAHGKAGFELIDRLRRACGRANSRFPHQRRHRSRAAARSELQRVLPTAQAGLADHAAFGGQPAFEEPAGRGHRS